MEQDRDWNYNRNKNKIKKEVVLRDPTRRDQEKLQFEMSIAETDWQSFLSPHSDLPPDVYFNVEGEDDKSEGQSYKKNIGGHRGL